MHPRFEETAATLEARFAEDSAAPWADDVFGSHAFAVFAVQYESCSVYRSFCDARGVTPSNVAAWTDIPAVPGTAFKYFDFIDDGAVAPEATFRTSGTTRGDEARGRHLVPRLSLYRASLLAPFRAALVPDRSGAHFLSLIPDPVEVPESSLSYMVGAAANELAGGIDWLVDAAGTWSGETEAVCRRTVDTGEPVVKEVLRREEIYEGPHVHNAPDLIVEGEMQANVALDRRTEITDKRSGIDGDLRRAASEHTAEPRKRLCRCIKQEVRIVEPTGDFRTASIAGRGRRLADAVGAVGRALQAHVHMVVVAEPRAQRAQKASVRPIALA